MFYKIENKMTPKSLTNEIWHKFEKKESLQENMWSMYLYIHSLDRIQKIFISSLHAVCFVVLPKKFFGLYGGH